MRTKKTIFYTLCLLFLGLFLLAGEVAAQPSEAALKKQLVSPKTVSVTLGGPGKVEWSSTYKKYMWTRHFTAKLKTDTPGEFLVVKGYAAYDVVGGRYTFWRTFTSANSFEGKKNPSLAEINQALEAADLREFARIPSEQIGEYESFKLAAAPDWEWHTPNSVSFTVVAVYRILNRGGSYGDEPQYQYRPGFKAIDKIEAHRRLRIYRKDGNSPWSGVGVSDSVPTPESKYRTRRVEKLLDRQIVTEAEAARLPRITRVPKLAP